MDPERQKHLKELFQSFLEVAPDKRAVFLDETCGDDSALRAELESLIAVDLPTGEFTDDGTLTRIPARLPQDELIGNRMGRYLIKEAVGSGGMGMIFKAEDTRLGRSVALKFLTPGLLEDEQAKARFFQEARAAAVLDHQNICTVYEIDEIEGQTFIAMAYIDGQSLKQGIVSGPVDLEETLDLVIQTAQGLEAAHKKGIVHRDIKPGNIMVTEEGQAKVVDFGLAKLSGQTRYTRTGVALGTIAYMSPEQARGEGVDHRTDVWSLGVVLYEMLTGRLPFRGEDIQSVIFSILHEDPPPLTDFLPGLPRGLEETVSRALAKSLDERYLTIKDMLVDLRLLKHDPKSIITIRRPSPLKGMPSIAVLPFKDMSPDKDQEYFCDGMAEEIINALSKLKQLRVVARTSAFSFKDEKIDIRGIGEKLSVETVLEGSVRKANSRVRITAQLVNVADGYHLWSDRFDRDMEDIFAIQDEITLAIADELKVQLLAGEKSKLIKPRKVDQEAYQLYLRGLHFYFKATGEGYEKALQYFHQALEKDPNYALPYVLIAEVYFGIGLWKIAPPNEAFQKAKDAVEKALKLDDNLGEAHNTMAELKWQYDWDFDGAEKEFKRAIELNPSWALAHENYGLFLAHMGRSGEAISEASRAAELDPLSAWMGTGLGIVFYYARQYDRAFDELQKAIEIDPNFYPAYQWLAEIYQKRGMYKEAFDAVDKLSSVLSFFYTESDIWWFPACLHANAGSTEEAERILKAMYEARSKGYFPILDIAAVHMTLGQIDRGFECYEKACEERDHFLIWTMEKPDSDSFRNDPRFEALRKKIGM